LSSRSIQPVFQALGFLSQRERAGAARALLEAVPAPAPRARGRRSGKLEGRLTLRGVGLLKAKDGRWLFRGLDLAIEPGEIVAVSGADGTGKSALLRLLSARWAPTEGEVLADGVPVAAWDRSALFGQIVLVDDQPVMLEGTIVENMTMFDQLESPVPHASLLDVLGIGGMVAKLAAGFETRLGTGAEDISNDLRQRIAIARAVLQRPSVLLLDEVDSNLDLDGTQQLMALLTKLKGAVTIVLVSHRPSVLRIADRRFTVVDGRLKLQVEQGEAPLKVDGPPPLPDKGALPS